MKNKYLRKLSLAFVIVLALAQVFSLCVFAQEDLEWEWEEYDTVLRFGAEIYEIYEPSVNLYFIAGKVLEFSIDDHYGGIYVNKEHFEEGTSDIALFSFGESFYANDNGKIALDGFLSGDIGGFLLDGGGDIFYNSDLGKDTVESLDNAYNNGSDKVEIDVRELKKLDLFEVLAYDKTKTAAYVYGAIYESDGVYYYVNYSALGNQFFDAEGDFSYRSGVLELAVLDTGLAAKVDSVKEDFKDNYPEYHLYNDLAWVDIEYDEATAVIGFWVSFVFAGFILPTVFVILGLTLPRSRKLGRCKYWYLLAILGAVWMILAAMLMLLILLI